MPAQRTHSRGFEPSGRRPGFIPESLCVPHCPEHCARAVSLSPQSEAWSGAVSQPHLAIDTEPRGEPAAATRHSWKVAEVTLQNLTFISPLCTAALCWLLRDT